MCSLGIAIGLFLNGLADVNPPGLVATIGSAAFRHPSVNPTGGVQLLGTSADGKRVYTKDWGGCSGGVRITTIFVWDAETGRLINSYWPGEHVGQIWQYRLTREGLRVIAFPRKDNLFDPWKNCRLCLIDVDAGRLLSEGKSWQPERAQHLGVTNGFCFARAMPSDVWTIHRTEASTLLLNADTGETLDLELKLDKGADVDISRDGRLAVAAPSKDRWLLYELPRMKVRAEWECDENHELGTFTPDNKFISCWHKKKSGWAFELWSVSDKTRRTLMDGLTEQVWVVFSPSSKLMASEKFDPEGRPAGWEIRDTATTRILYTLPPGCHSPYFDEEWKTLWVIRGRRLLIALDMLTGKPKLPDLNQYGTIDRFRFRGEEKVVGLCDNAVITWDSKSGNESSRFAMPSNWNRDAVATFSPRGDRLLYVDKDGNAISWGYQTGDKTKLQSLQGDRAAAEIDEQLTIDGRMQVVRVGKKWVVRDLAAGKLLGEASVPDDWLPGEGRPSVWARAASLDGKYVALVRNDDSNGCQVGLIHFIDGRASLKALNAGIRVECLSFSPDCQSLVVLGKRRLEPDEAIETRLRLISWDLQHLGEPQTQILPPGSVYSAHYSPAGNLIAVHVGERVLILDAKTHVTLARVKTGRPNFFSLLPEEREGDTLAWSPSGKLLAFQLADERLAIWDVQKLLEK